MQSFLVVGLIQKKKEKEKERANFKFNLFCSNFEF